MSGWEKMNKNVKRKGFLFMLWGSKGHEAWREVLKQTIAILVSPVTILGFMNAKDT